MEMNISVLIPEQIKETIIKVIEELGYEVMDKENTIRYVIKEWLDTTLGVVNDEFKEQIETDLTEGEEIERLINKGLVKQTYKEE